MTDKPWHYGRPWRPLGGDHARRSRACGCSPAALAIARSRAATTGPGREHPFLQSQPPTTVAYPSLNSQPFGTDHLGGDWGGVRPWLEDHGIYIGLNYYPEIAAIVAGGQRQGIDYTSQLGLSVDLDGQRLLGWTGFAVHSVIVQRNGRSASADFLDDDLDAVQQIFGGGGDVAAHLVYLYGEQQFYGGMVDIAGGRLPVGTFFAASPIYCNFVNVIFCGNPHPLPVYPGEPDWPAATWGGMARVYVLPTVYAMGGVFQVNPNFGGPSGWDLFIHGTTGVSVPLEVGWTPASDRTTCSATTRSASTMTPRPIPTCSPAPTACRSR